MCEFVEIPCRKLKRHLRALPGIPDMRGLGIIQRHHTCPAPIWPPSGPPSHLPCRKKLWAATYSPLHPPKEPVSILPCRALCPGRRLLPMLSPNLPGQGLSQQEGKNQRVRGGGGGAQLWECHVSSIHDCRSCQTAATSKTQASSCLGNTMSSLVPPALGVAELPPTQSLWAPHCP